MKIAWLSDFVCGGLVLVGGLYHLYSANFNGYQARYWKPAYFEVVNKLSGLCREHGIEPAAAALRWLFYHSTLATEKDAPGNGRTEHGIILGASSLSHFNQNL
ncbi:hypothetical protein N9383_02135 [Granulosicoccus sp.]|nr:hypothetical protein [Granulosicoccus sp.]